MNISVSNLSDIVTPNLPENPISQELKDFSVYINYGLLAVFVWFVLVLIQAKFMEYDDKFYDEDCPTHPCVYILCMLNGLCIVWLLYFLLKKTCECCYMSSCTSNCMNFCQKKDEITPNV